MKSKKKSKAEQIKALEKSIKKFGDHDGSRKKKLEGLKSNY